MVEVVVVSSDDGTEPEETVEERKKRRDKEAASSEVVRWENYLPKMVLRVLLVEADDSTRRIIAALLRNCSYKVAAVSDGLMAWETLKGRPQNIDLVLTELDLPSISGFALLTLVMEHEACKNIPVIMMSSQDSISMVLKCMLRGAADYLIKPVRKNELMNLWQHVWRRHALRLGPIRHSLPASQPKLEATAENNADCKAFSTNTHKNSNNKGSDAQSSCSSRFVEAESAYVQNVQGVSQLKCGNGNISNSCPLELMENVKSHEESVFLDQMEEKLDCSGTGEGQMPTDERDGFKVLGRNADSYIGAPESSNVTMDLIGVFDKRPEYLHSDDGSIEDVGPELELSLKRSCSESSRNRDNIERQKLCHSNVSAFSRYDNGKPLQQVVAATANGSYEPKTPSEWHEQFNRVNSDMRSATTSSSQENMASCISGQSGQVELSSQNQVLEPVFFPNTDISQLAPTTSQAKYQQDSVTEPDFHESEETLNCSVEPIREKDSQEHENEHNCQSTTNSWYEGFAYCSESTAHEATFPEKSKDEQNIVLSNDGFRGMVFERSSQREAALTKFRMKRKDRCFEKKVRYQSRKKLAEQRPRVKGQFVRAVYPETPAPDALNGT